MPGPLQNFCKQLIWILRPVKGEKVRLRKMFCCSSSGFDMTTVHRDLCDHPNVTIFGKN